MSRGLSGTDADAGLAGDMRHLIRRWIATDEKSAATGRTIKLTASA